MLRCGCVLLIVPFRSPLTLGCPKTRNMESIVGRKVAVEKILASGLKGRWPDAHIPQAEACEGFEGWQSRELALWAPHDNAGSRVLHRSPQECRRPLLLGR